MRFDCWVIAFILYTIVFVVYDKAIHWQYFLGFKLMIVSLQRYLSYLKGVTKCDEASLFFFFLVPHHGLPFPFPFMSFTL